jgi:hypothetical protein
MQAAKQKSALPAGSPRKPECFFRVRKSTAFSSSRFVGSLKRATNVNNKNLLFLFQSIRAIILC